MVKKYLRKWLGIDELEKKMQINLKSYNMLAESLQDEVRKLKDVLETDIYILGELEKTFVKVTENNEDSTNGKI